MNDDSTENNELFSDDPEEQLRIENEILKLKLKAELDGAFEPLSDVSPEIENLFLKNVIAFEHAHANAPVTTLHKMLGEPGFTKSSELNDEQVQVELDKLEDLMESKGIVVDYLADYSARLKYEFVTGELFNKEDVMMGSPAMTMHYIYEEFHPNHEHSIKLKAEAFIDDWFNQSFNEYSTELDFELITADGQLLTKKELLDKLQLVFDSYDYFTDTDFIIDEISFQMNEDGTGLGFAEGGVKYNAIMENGETVSIKGPFKLYMQSEDDYWQIMYFVWPGFSWS